MWHFTQIPLDKEILYLPSKCVQNKLLIIRLYWRDYKTDNFKKRLIIVTEPIHDANVQRQPHINETSVPNHLYSLSINFTFYPLRVNNTCNQAYMNWNRSRELWNNTSIFMFYYYILSLFTLFIRRVSSQKGQEIILLFLCAIVICSCLSDK